MACLIKSFANWTISLAVLVMFRDNKLALVISASPKKKTSATTSIKCGLCYSNFQLSYPSSTDCVESDALIDSLAAGVSGDTLALFFFRHNTLSIWFPKRIQFTNSPTLNSHIHLLQQLRFIQQ